MDSHCNRTGCPIPVGRRDLPSSRSVASNSSSHKTHRRTYIDVSSMMYELENPKALSKDHDELTFCCTSKEDATDHETAMELIRKLSFDTGANTLSERETFRPAIVVVRRDDTLTDRVDSPDAFSPIALPPKIQRMGGVTSSPNLFPQIPPNRHRLRSTSLSELSDGCPMGPWINGEEEVESRAFSEYRSSFVPYRAKSIGVIPSTIDNPTSASMAISPPLPPSSRHQPSIPWNRGRSSTFTSDQSSYISPASSTNIHGSLSDGYSISSYEDENCLDDPPGFYEEDRSIFGSEGYRSCQEHSHGDDSQVRPTIRARLSSETLREWNNLCREEGSRDIFVRKQRGEALDHPQVFVPHDVDALEPKERIEVKTHETTADLPTHLMATIGSFSYTNSLPPPSTISSGLDDISELDFDMGFVFSLNPSHRIYEIFEIGPSPSTTESKDGEKRRVHRRSRSSMAPHKPSNSKSTSRRVHRRYRSDDVRVNQVMTSDPTILSKSQSRYPRLSHVAAKFYLGEDLVEKICWFFAGGCFGIAIMYVFGG